MIISNRPIRYTYLGKLIPLVISYDCMIGIDIYWVAR